MCCSCRAEWNSLCWWRGPRHYCMDTTSGKVAYSIQDAHSSRIKGLVAFKSRSDDPEASNFVVSASSDGFIRVWDVRMTTKDKPTPLAEANTKSRLTCLAGSSLRM
uniref:Uncharacterized protein n=1 Tax=Ananas comosus var. bracteatus TaxID=296719 RepID=A0A6V7PBA3_ANACO|nr:unnamed protein product [Ananas comosus var. bracteatus]